MDTLGLLSGGEFEMMSESGMESLTRRLHTPIESEPATRGHRSLILGTILTAIVFVSVLALFDLVKSYFRYVESKILIESTWSNPIVPIVPSNQDEMISDVFEQSVEVGNVSNPAGKRKDKQSDLLENQASFILQLKFTVFCVMAAIVAVTMFAQLQSLSF